MIVTLEYKSYYRIINEKYYKEDTNHKKENKEHYDIDKKKEKLIQIKVHEKLITDKNNSSRNYY